MQHSFLLFLCGPATKQTPRILSNLDINTLPAEDVSVDGPCSRTEQCKADAEDYQQDMSHAATLRRKSNQQLDNGSDAAHNRCPEATEQGDSYADKDGAHLETQRLGNDPNLWNSLKNERSPNSETQQEQSCAWPPSGKSGK